MCTVQGPHQYYLAAVDPERGVARYDCRHCTAYWTTILGKET